MSLKPSFISKLRRDLGFLLSQAYRIGKPIDRDQVTQEQVLRQVLDGKPLTNVNDKVDREIQYLASSNDSLRVKARALASILGRAEWMRLIWPKAKPWMRQAQAILGIEALRVSWETTIHLGRYAILDLATLLARMPNHESRSMRKGPFKTLLEARCLATDASKLGYGGRVDLGQGDVVEVAGFFSEPELVLPIHLKESIAVCRVLEALGRRFPEKVRDRRLVLQSDSAALVSAWAKWSARSLPLNLVIKRIHQLTEQLDLELEIHHLAGELNVVADGLSRFPIKQEWGVKPSVVLRALTHFGLRLIDLDAFASDSLHVSSRYYTRAQTEGSSGMDGLLMPWEGVTWVCPPLALVAASLATWVGKWQTSSTALLFAPHWTGANWWSTLMQYSTNSYPLGEVSSWLETLYPSSRCEILDNSGWRFSIFLLERRS